MTPLWRVIRRLQTRPASGAGRMAGFLLGLATLPLPLPARGADGDEPPNSQIGQDVDAEDGYAADAGSPEAEQLFRQARRLLDGGRPLEACVYLQRSQQLEPAIGTLLNLGLCNRQGGRLASAWHAYRDAQEMARAMGDSERETLAEFEAAELEPVLGRLVVVLAPDRATDLRLLVDGNALAVGTATSIPLDAGEHTIRAEAADRVPWDATVRLRDGATLTVDVPRLAETSSPREPPRPASAADRVELPPSPGASEPTRAEGAGLRPTTAAMFGLGGASVVGFGTAIVYALKAKNENDASATECRSNNVCTPRGVDLRDTARAHAAAATVATTVGATALVGAAVLWFVDRGKSPRSARPKVGVAVTARHQGFRGPLRKSLKQAETGIAGERATGGI